MTSLNLAAAAIRLGVLPEVLRAWADQGKVVSVQSGFDRRFRVEDLDAFTGVAEGIPFTRRDA